MARGISRFAATETRLACDVESARESSGGLPRVRRIHRHQQAGHVRAERADDGLEQQGARMVRLHDWLQRKELGHALPAQHGHSAKH